MVAAEQQRPAEGPYAIGDDEVAAVIVDAGGDPLEAIRMLLRDLSVMAAGADAAASRGFLRGKFSQGRCRPRVVDEL